ncbi:hypothetical protein GLOIN_2v1504917, partial [Rhizophagus irregularis DAOM 181602=DAOM 197198]
MIMHPKWCSVTYIFTIMISFFFVFGEKNILIRVIMMIVRSVNFINLCHFLLGFILVNHI